MSFAHSWVEVIVLVIALAGLAAGYLHIECDRPGCRRICRAPSGYCRKHRERR